MSKLWNSSWWKHSQLRTLGTQRWMSKCGFYFNCFSCYAACSYQLNMNNTSVCSKVTPPSLHTHHNPTHPFNTFNTFNTLPYRAERKRILLWGLHRFPRLHTTHSHTGAAPGSLTPGYGYNALAGRRKTTTTNMEYSDSVSTHSVSDVIIYRYVNLAWLICVISLTTSNSERNL